jgi:serine/threonine protein kinase
MLMDADNLLGLELEDGWKVIEKIKKKPEDTGGHFSVGYIAENGTKKAFVKAIDFSSASQKADPLKAAQSILDAYIFERDLLLKCERNKLSRIVMPLGHGRYMTGGRSPFDDIYYILFELAAGDIRKQLNIAKYFDLAWVLRSLHNTAVGLEQLHRQGIAHQDLKPSNVLVFGNQFKVGDLGRASDEAVKAEHDQYQIPGDQTYYPFDAFYRISHYSDFSFRYAIDLYLLGSLVFFFFFKLNLKELLITELLQRDLMKNLTRSDFYADLPYFQMALDSVMQRLDVEIRKYSNRTSNMLMPLIKMLCELDPNKRGHNKNVSTGISQYSLERFISSFDIIAKYAEYKIYE